MKQTYLAMEAVEKKPRFEVYVAGLPPAIDHSSLKAYFRSFGRVNKIYIYTQNTQYPNHAATKVKLHCKVTVQDESTYLRILSEQNHCFMGRHLFCQEFKKGRELSDHNAHVKNRRVIVKKVPSYFTENMLLELIHARFGAVDTIYEFKTDALDLPTVNKRFKSFSVSFRQPEILENIPGSLAIPLPGSHHHITIERFEQRLFKDFSGGSDNTTSDQKDTSKQVLKKLERVANQRRSAYSQVLDKLGEPQDSLPINSANLAQPASESHEASRQSKAAQATFISEDGNMISSSRSPVIADLRLPNHCKDQQHFGEKKSPMWLTRNSDHRISNLRFNVFRSCSDRPSQVIATHQLSSARN
jgi:uncharacterized Fe-S cluster-containing protein